MHVVLVELRNLGVEFVFNVRRILFVLRTLAVLDCGFVRVCVAFLLAFMLVRESGACDVLVFDGMNDRVLVPYDASFPTEEFTLAAWIKMTPPGHRSAVIARGEDNDSFNLSWQLYVEPGGTLQIMLENSSEQNFCYPLTCLGATQASCSSLNMFVADDQWHHIVATRNLAGDLSLYVDGQSRASCTLTGVPSSNNFQFLSIGCTHGTIGPPPGGIEPPIWFFPGAIDDAAVWNFALSQSEVTQVYSFGVNPADSGLIGLWRFDEGSGQTVADASGMGNHGYLGADPSGDTADPQWASMATPVCITATPSVGDWALVVLVLGFCCLGLGRLRSDRRRACPLGKWAAVDLVDGVDVMDRAGDGATSGYVMK